MIDIYKEEIERNEDLVDIADIITSDSDFKKRLKDYIASPYDRAEYLKESKIPPISFNSKGETLYLAGMPKAGADMAKVENVIAKSVEKGYLSALHFVSPYGIFATLVESAAVKKYGFDITSDSELEEKDFLFRQSGYVTLFSVDEEYEDELADLFFNNGVQLVLLGHVTKGELRVDDQSYGYITDYLPE